VYLLRCPESQSLYALKGLCKKHIMEEKMEVSVKNERSTMDLLDSDFIVRLHKSYQDSRYIYFMLEAALGGELFDIYTENDLFGKIDHARFYVACITMGLSHMHLKRVIYRDLKLENCLLCPKGYCKLTDMGIAKVVIGKTYTVCGTADYFAPETLRQVGHNRAVDWWALGVMTFIMCAGRSPFDAPEVSQIYKNIIKGFSKVKFPKTFPSDLIDCIKSLCRKKPEERVTMQKGGVDNFKEMPFFSSICWEKVAHQKQDPPFIPAEIDFQKIRDKKAERPFTLDVNAVQAWDGGIESGGRTEGLNHTGNPAEEDAARSMSVDEDGSLDKVV
jgi:cGMP-dependent protein kinase